MRLVISFLILALLGHITSAATADQSQHPGCLMEAMAAVPTERLHPGDVVLPPPRTKKVADLNDGSFGAYYFVAIGTADGSVLFGYMMELSRKDCSQLAPPITTLRVD